MKPARARSILKFVVLSALSLTLIGGFVCLSGKCTPSSTESAANNTEVAAKKLAQQLDTPSLATKTVIELKPSSPVLEIAGAEKSVAIDYTYTTKWPNVPIVGSIKTLKIKATYLGKVGIDATKPLVVNSLSDKAFELDLPTTVLSVEMQGDPTFYVDNGVVNKLQPEEMASAVAHMQKLARQQLSQDKELHELARRNICEGLRRRCGGIIPIRPSRKD